MHIMRTAILLGVWLLSFGVLLTAQGQKQPTAAELSKNETPGKAFTRFFGYQEYQFRSAAEAMPEEKWNYRPAPGLFKDEKPQFGPAEERTFAEQVKHVACSNFSFAAFLDGTHPPEGCDKGGPSPARSRVELLNYLRDSFTALKKSLGAISEKNMYDPIEGLGNTRLGVGIVSIWHVGTTTARWLFTCAKTASCRQQADQVPPS